MKRKKVLVVGLAKSGLAAARLLLREGADVWITDEKTKQELAPALKNLPRRVHVAVGSSAVFSIPFDLIVTSPGVPWNHPNLAQARKRNIPVWPELELGWRFSHPKKTVAVTGTNGKTTTTALIGHILKKSGAPTMVGGNIGTPLSALARRVTRRTTLVLEVSSYQLEGHRTFHPNVGVLLNLTPDHLARHRTMAGYAQAKGNLFRLFTPRDLAVVNGGDAWCRRIVRRIKTKKVFFPNKKDAALAAHIRLPGAHNWENAMAAVAAARALGVSERNIVRGLETFKGVPHRIQVVRRTSGVTYVNDSKATNVDSTAVALKSFSSPIVLIAGGEHKGSSYAPLIPLVKKRVKRILTIGEAAKIIAKDLKGAAPIEACGTLEKAVLSAQKAALPGDVVLLSPACASFDQFRNFEHRGDEFARLVRRLKP